MGKVEVTKYTLEKMKETQRKKVIGKVKEKQKKNKIDRNLDRK